MPLSDSNAVHSLAANIIPRSLKSCLPKQSKTFFFFCFPRSSPWILWMGLMKTWKTYKMAARFIWFYLFEVGPEPIPTRVQWHFLNVSESFDWKGVCKKPTLSCTRTNQNSSDWKRQNCCHTCQFELSRDWEMVRNKLTHSGPAGDKVTTSELKWNGRFQIVGNRIRCWMNVHLSLLDRQQSKGHSLSRAI